MEIPPNKKFMPVSEAIGILQRHTHVNHAVLEILQKCNIIITDASRVKLRKKLLVANVHRREESRHGRLPLWLTWAEKEEFCRYILPPEEEPLEVIEAEPAEAIEVEPVEEGMEDEDEDYVPPAVSKTGGRPKSPLTPALDRSTLYRRVSARIPALQEMADLENTNIMQFLIIVLVFLCNQCGWTKLAKVLYAVFVSMSEIDESNEISIEKSGYLLASQELGREKYTDVRNTLSSEGIKIQPWHKVNEHFETITPARLPVTIDPDEGQIGWRFNFEDVCKYSVNRALLAKGISADQLPDNIYIGGKDGTDGSGQHFRRATLRVAVKGNILLYSWAPLLICKGDSANGEVLWKNPAPNSALTQRPLAIIGAKEDKEEVLRPFLPLIEADIVTITQNGFDMMYEDKQIHVTVESVLTMFDGKMHANFNGSLGAFCLMCKASKLDCHNIECVRTGFPVNREIQDMWEIFEGLDFSDDGKVVTRPGDYGTRAGVTSEPITHRDLNSSLSQTHAWSCITTWFFHFLYHLVANDKTWGFGNEATARYQRLMTAKTKVQNEVKDFLGKTPDAVDGTGHTGTSTTGPLAKRFFDDDCREVLDILLNGQQLNIVKKLHLNLNVILRTISSKDKQIDVEKFGNLCTDTYIDILTHFKWVNLTPTLHKILAHSTEIIKNNACIGVGHLSEEGLEACHKIIRRFRTSWTLQSSDDANLKDLIKKMFIISDPLFYSFRRVLKCSRCGSIGHQRNCSVVMDATKKSVSDLMVEGMFVG